MHSTQQNHKREKHKLGQNHSLRTDRAGIHRLQEACELVQLCTEEFAVWLVYDEVSKGPKAHLVVVLHKIGAVDLQHETYNNCKLWKEAHKEASERDQRLKQHGRHDEEAECPETVRSSKTLLMETNTRRTRV